MTPDRNDDDAALMRLMVGILGVGVALGAFALATTQLQLDRALASADTYAPTPIPAPPVQSMQAGRDTSVPDAAQAFRGRQFVEVEAEAPTF